MFFPLGMGIELDFRRTLGAGRILYDTFPALFMLIVIKEVTMVEVWDNIIGDGA